MQKRRKYSQEFKREAVNTLETLCALPLQVIDKVEYFHAPVFQRLRSL